MKPKIIVPFVIAVVIAIVPLTAYIDTIRTQGETVSTQSNVGQALQANKASSNVPDVSATPSPSPTVSDADSLKASTILDAPVVKQTPGLYNGCEVSSLAMLLQFEGIKADKMALAGQIKKDTTPLVKDKDGNVVSWGDPNYGFVGDITGKKPGYGVYDGPLMKLLQDYMPEKAVDLTGESFDSLLKSVQDRNPVVTWVTINFNIPEDFITWESGGKDIKATFSEHAVLLVGYDKNYCYVNNPYNGQKDEKISRSTFEQVWESMGSMAISCT